MSEINGIEERLDDLPGSEAPSRLTASRASGSTQLFGVAKARRARPWLRCGFPRMRAGAAWQALALPGRPRGQAGLPEGGLSGVEEMDGKRARGWEVGNIG